MPPKKPSKAKPPVTKIQEFNFDADLSTSGKLTYRCLEFVVQQSEGKRWTVAELDFWKDVVETLNLYFQHMK